MLSAEHVWTRFEYNPLNGELFYKGKRAGSKRPDGIRIQIKKKSYYARTGSWPDKLIDHINGVRHDNRAWNLRQADHLINNQNRSDKPGICYVPKRKKYRAY